MPRTARTSAGGAGIAFPSGGVPPLPGGVTTGGVVPGGVSIGGMISGGWTMGGTVTVPVDSWGEVLPG